MNTDHDLKTPEGVAALMRTSKTESEWNANCDAVKEAHAFEGRSTYPSFWWATIMQSGLASEVTSKF